jgi:hypothetical protein
VVCSSCGTGNEAGRKFCKECAARLAVGCSSCGAANGADAKFRGECATPLPAAGAPAGVQPRPGHAATAATPLAGRRLVSILFADLVGFTTFAEGRDAEVRAAADAARRTFAELGARPFVERLDAALARSGRPGHGAGGAAVGPRVVVPE